jgi:hypothetical protein
MRIILYYIFTRTHSGTVLRRYVIKHEHRRRILA